MVADCQALTRHLAERPAQLRQHLRHPRGRHAGPWSDPVDLNVGGLIDPGHAVGEDGQRYLFFSGINRVRLAADGLSTAGPVEKVYGGWRYPDGSVTEAFSLEEPKLLFRNGWFYMITAEGGISGPPTGHMVVIARARSLDGPRQNCCIIRARMTTSERAYLMAY